MTIKQTYDAIDQIPEMSVRDLYQVDDTGKAVLKGFETEEGVRGLKTALASERKAREQFERQVKAYGDRKPEDIETLMHEYEMLKTQAGQAKPDADQIEKVRELERKRAEIEIERMKASLAEKDKLANEYMTKDRERTIADAIRSAATKAKVLPEAVDKLIVLARGDMTLGDDGKVIGSDGVTTVDDWMGALQQSAPYFWGTSQGGGARGGVGGNGGGTVYVTLEESQDAKKMSEYYKKGINPVIR